MNIVARIITKIKRFLCFLYAKINLYYVQFRKNCGLCAGQRVILFLGRRISPLFLLSPTEDQMTQSKRIFCYQHHIEKYDTDTVGLSILQHGAYRRLLDFYYKTGAKLPSDLKLLYIIISCQKKWGIMLLQKQRWKLT